MTLFRTEDALMTSEFHAPDRPIYTTVEEAEVVAKKMYLEWVEKSMVATESIMVSFEECYGQYTWWPERKEEHQLFLNDLKAGKIDYAIVKR